MLCASCLPRSRHVRGQLPILLMMVFVEVHGDVYGLIVLCLENICKATICTHIPFHESALNSLLSIKEGTISYQFPRNWIEEHFIVPWRVSQDTVCKIMQHATHLSFVQLTYMFAHWYSVYPSQLSGAKTNFPDHHFFKFTNLSFFVPDILNTQSFAQCWSLPFHTWYILKYYLTPEMSKTDSLNEKKCSKNCCK